MRWILRAALGLVLIGWSTTAAAITYTWTGGGGQDVNWSTPANWGGDAPSSGESGVELIFPALDGAYASNNDLSSLRVTSLAVTTRLSPGVYEFSGNLIILEGPVAMVNPDSGNPNLVWQIPIALGSNVIVTTDGRQTRLLGAIDFGPHTLFLDAIGDVVLGGTLSGSGGLVKQNGSALTILGENSYTGSTTVDGGAVYIHTATAFGDPGAGTTFPGGALGLPRNSAFTLAEPLLFSGGDIIAYGAAKLAGQMILLATPEVQTFEPDTALTITGSMVGRAGITKSGPGELILATPEASYAGTTTVSDGVLRLDAELSGAGGVSVGPGGTLVGSGSTNGAIASGGTLAPGASPGRFEAAELALLAGGVFEVEIDGPGPMAYDRIGVAGGVALGGAALAVTLNFTPADGQQFSLISRQQGGAVSGTFDGLPEGATLAVDGTTFTITYAGGANGSDVVLIAGIPPTHTPTVSGAPTSTPTPTQPGVTPTATPIGCVGDCNGDGAVTVNELVIGVNIALGTAPVSACPAFDAGGDGQVTIVDLIQGVNNLLDGCPA